MRFLFRNAVFILFPVVLVAIVFIAQIVFKTAVSYGKWGERSIAESIWLVANEKIERVEQELSLAADLFFEAVNPSRSDISCKNWQNALSKSKLVRAAVVVNEEMEVVSFFVNTPDPGESDRLFYFIIDEIIPFVDKYDSLNQYKHIHKYMGGNYYFISHYTTVFEDSDYTSILLFDTDYITFNFFNDTLESLSSQQIISVVDDYNHIIFGSSVNNPDAFIVARRFPSSLYRWRLQVAATTTYKMQKSKEKAKISRAMLIPLALGVIILGIAILYLSIVRERRLNRLKSEFVANVSHELKTPLSLIRMFTELLLMKKSLEEEKRTRYHNIIFRETKRLASLIDNVLDFARIERGKSAYDFQEAWLPETVERTVDIFKHEIEKRSINLVVNLPDDFPLVRVDEHAITLALINLIDNAVKYGTGTDVIGVELFVKAGTIHIDVYDHGDGIDEVFQKRVFDRFYRVPDAKVRKNGGSGIGLSLVSHIAEAHGGKVVLTSKPHKETRFSMRIGLSGVKKRIKKKLKSNERTRRKEKTKKQW